jgi:hypothetical protein
MPLMITLYEYMTNVERGIRRERNKATKKRTQAGKTEGTITLPLFLLSLPQLLPFSHSTHK